MKKKEGVSQEGTSPKRLYRCDDRKIIAGVACGIADYFQLDPTLVRLFFIFLTFFSGIGILLYIILWIIIPSEHETDREQISLGDMSSARHWVGIILIAFGALVFLQNVGLFRSGDIWPLLLVIFGIFLLIRK